MRQDIIINSTLSETRIAILEDGQLVELYVERPEKERMVGSLYKGVVRKVAYGISAAFVDIGLSQDAFLHFSDIGGGNDLVKIAHEMDLEEAEEEVVHGGRSKNTYEHAEAPRLQRDDLKVGQEILVQVIKEPIGRKGPRVSTQIALPGRYIVLVPNESFIGVSRKIANLKEKKRLRQIAQTIRPKGFGIIVRTLAEGKSDEELGKDVERVLKVWGDIENSLRRKKTPGLLYRDISLTSSLIRDLFSPEVSHLVVDSRKLYREIIQYLDEVSPSLKSRVELYSSPIPIFDKFGIEAEIEKSLLPQLPLPSGGYINIEQTEALVAIDVNSGRFQGKKDHEDNALKVNLEAVREICRQLRLRDIGGIIVIDFIDMAEEKHRRMVFEEMKRL
ncbi:MAG: Rne/Rng family ribonuclease, partial [bacterium]